MGWNRIMTLLLVGGSLAPPALAQALAISEQPVRVEVPTERGLLRAEVNSMAGEPGAHGTFVVEGSDEPVEVATTPSKDSLGSFQVDVRYGRHGSIRFLMTSAGPVLIAEDVGDCAAVGRLDVMSAAAQTVATAAERLARPGAVDDPESAPLTAGYALAAAAVLAPTLVDSCKDTYPLWIRWRCVEYEWEEDCANCCHNGRMLTDVASVFCGTLAAMFCAPSVVGTGVCAGVGAAGCLRLGEMAERGCIGTCAPLPRKPREGEPCGPGNMGACQDTCPGLPVNGVCAAGFVCCRVN